MWLLLFQLSQTRGIGGFKWFNEFNWFMWLLLFQLSQTREIGGLSGLTSLIGLILKLPQNQAFPSWNGFPG